MQSTRGGWVDSQLHQQHRVLFGRPTCNDRPSKIYAWTMLKRSLTLLHLAGRIYSSTSSVLPQPLPSPPPPPTRSEGSWLAGQPEALELKLTLSERWPVPFLPPSSCPWPATSAGSPPQCYRGVLGTLRPDAAYLETIVTASAPLGLSSISQAETLALSQSDVPIHKRQPIIATL